MDRHLARIEKRRTKHGIKYRARDHAEGASSTLWQNEELRSALANYSCQRPCWMPPRM